jgi:hypothetical protein
MLVCPTTEPKTCIWRGRKRTQRGKSTTRTSMEQSGGLARKSSAVECWAGEWGKDKPVNNSYAQHSLGKSSRI